MGISAAEYSRRLKKITQPMLQEQVQEIITQQPTPLKQAKENELLQGIKPDGSKIGKYKNRAYATAKSSQNPKAGFGNVDLIRSGRFVSSLIPYRSGGNKYLFSQNVRYGHFLVNRYGRDNLGLNQDTFNNIQKVHYRPLIVQFIKKQLGQ